VTTGDSLDVYPECIKQNLVQVFFKAGRLVLQPRGLIGLIPINDRLAVDVGPRFPIANLERIIAVGEQNPISLRQYQRWYALHTDCPPSFLDALTVALVGAVDAVQAKRGHHDYERAEAATSLPKGRILINATLSRQLSRGVRHRVSAAWFEPTSDTPPNRCLKYALWFLAQRYARMRPRAGLRTLLADLNRAFSLFRHASLDKARGFLRDAYVCEPDRLPDLFSHYKDALCIAKCIISERGLALRGAKAELKMATLLLRMDDGFESYIRRALALALPAIDSTIAVFDGNVGGPRGARKPLFDGSPSPASAPDIVLARGGEASGPGTVVVEVKYEHWDTPDRDTLNQAITYGVSHRSPCVVIVHPSTRSSMSGLEQVGKIDRLTVCHYAFDLGSKDLESEERSLAAALSALVASPEFHGRPT